MDLNRFHEIHGISIEPILGQYRLGFGKNDFEDFYDVHEWPSNSSYQGTEFFFFDFEKRLVYQPFEKQKNVTYGNPVFYDGFYYFLRGDFNQGKITLYKYFPGICCNAVHELAAESVHLYNLMLLGNGVHIVSQDKHLVCYYPEQFECPMQANEAALCIDHGKIYFNAWVEEGVENDKITDNYKYYDQMVVKDISGKVLSVEKGSLQRQQDGTWWLS